jgi:hypothetical protein
MTVYDAADRAYEEHSTTLTNYVVYIMNSSGQLMTPTAFTRCKLVRASQDPGIRTQTFHASRIMEAATRFKVKPVEVSITCVKNLRAHRRDLTRVSQLASCKRGLVFETNGVLSSKSFFLPSCVSVRNTRTCVPTEGGLFQTQCV